MVERDLMTLGETTSQLCKRKVMLSNADRIINRCNALVHQYDQVTPKTIWYAVQNELEVVRAKALALLVQDEQTTEEEGYWPCP
jgi:uncharacterized protein with HEPN domain